MIKVNLLPVKKKKKAKPVPTFVVIGILVLLLTSGVMAYLVYFFNGKVAARAATVSQNEKKIAELKAKIKSVEDFEKRNAAFKQKKDIIDQLSKNTTLPVKVLDEIARQVTSGVWLTSLDIKGMDVSMSCTGFSNNDVVEFVNNLKNSKMFTDVYLQESVQGKIDQYAVYQFRLTMKVKA